MKKIRVICVILSLLLVISVGTQTASAAVDASVTSGCHTVDAVKPLTPQEKKVETSKAVLLYELGSDTLIYGWNLDDVIYPSSMVKLMTAIIALEKGDPADRVVVTKRALSYVAMGSVSAGLEAGEEVSLEDLLYCMMAASANDAAVVIAEHIAGSQQAFLDMMNAKAKELGCTNTNYSNVHGLHDELTYTTTRDIGKILDYALDDPYFRTLFEAKTYTMPATNKSEERIIHTTNYMMSKEVNKRYFDDRVTGGKTGATDEAGRCLAITAQINGMDLLGIVMGAVPTYEVDGIALATFGSFEEMSILLDFVSESYEFRQIFYEDQAVQQYPVAGGENDVAVKPAKALSAVLPLNLESNQLSWIYGAVDGSLRAPLKQGDAISSIQVWYGDTCIAQTDLVAMSDVDIYTEPSQSDLSDRVDEDAGGKIIAIVLGTILVLVLLGAFVLILIRWVRVTAAKSRRKRRRREQRRRS